MSSIRDLDELLEAARVFLQDLGRSTIDRDRRYYTAKSDQTEYPKKSKKTEAFSKAGKPDGKESHPSMKPEEKADSYDYKHNENMDLNFKTKKQEVNEEPEVTLPPEPVLEKPFYGIRGNVTYWGFSQQGASHIRKNMPCQDRCRLDFTEGKYSLLIAAIADGVGSCALSHYGSDIATKAAVSYLKAKIDQYHADSMEDKWIGDSLREAMQYALQSVAKTAEEMEQLEYSFQSTLTIAIYDEASRNLYVGHAGDDGVVALNSAGKIAMVTSRLKGEEITSVYPLQSGPSYWQVLKATDVNAFVMATDGVLDSFVRGESEDNRIYYPLIQPALEADQSDLKVVESTMRFYYDFMSGKDYRASVTDDLTILVVRNQPLINENNVPKFNIEEWNDNSEKYKRRVQKALYPDMAEHDSSQPEMQSGEQGEAQQSESSEKQEEWKQPDQPANSEEEQVQSEQLEKLEEAEPQSDFPVKPEEVEVQPDPSVEPEEAEPQSDPSVKPEEVEPQPDFSVNPEGTQSQSDASEKPEETQSQSNPPVNGSQSEPGLKVIPPIRNHVEKSRYYTENEDTSASGKSGKKSFVDRIRNKWNNEGGR